MVSTLRILTGTENDNLKFNIKILTFALRGRRRLFSWMINTIEGLNEKREKQNPDTRNDSLHHFCADSKTTAKQRSRI